MTRAAVFFFCIATFVGASRTGYALSAASTSALNSMKKLIAETKPVQEKCQQALDGNNKLKPGIDPSVLAGDGKKLSENVVKIAVASKGLDKADWGDPNVAAALAAFRSMRVTLIHVGYAAPAIFLSDSGKSRAASMQGYFDRIEKYKEELIGGGQRGRILHDIDNYSNRAKRDYNAMSKEDRGSPNGQALANDLRLVDMYLKEARDADKKSAETSKAAKEACKKFKDEMVNVNGNRGHMEGLIRLSQGKKPNRSYSSLNKVAIAGWLERIEAQKAMLANLGSWCSPAKVAVLEHCYSSHGKPRMEGLYAETDPVVWCSVAKDGSKLMIKEFEMFMKRDDEARTKRTSPDDLERKEGWFAEDRAVEWKSFFYVTKEDKDKAMGEYGQILAALGGDLTADPFASREKALAELRVAVERLAPKWKLPAKGQNFYGTGIAKKTVQRWYKGAKVLKTAGSSGQWSISKNALGVPLYRSRFGWILFKVKGSPLCQLRTFALGEDYKGGGKYQKSNHITFSKLRWQNCK